VYAEVVRGDVAGLNFYPGRDRVIGWFDAERLAIADEVLKPADGWAYRHFLLRGHVGRTPDPAAATACAAAWTYTNWTFV
jgi:hypothetical protein